MIRVSSSTIVHRPERLLYYLPENNNDEIKHYISDGVCPTSLSESRHAFGTYDEVGIFYLPPELQKETGMNYVVGIEIRKNDPRINLPQNLPFVVLPSCDVVIQDISYEYLLNIDLLEEIISFSRKCRNEKTSLYRDVPHGTVAAYCSKEKMRILYEIELIKGHGCISIGNFDEYSKEELFQRAYLEPITEYYNWNWMRERLKTYYLSGVCDYGFVHFDIKDFKMINELYNHDIANALLKRIAHSFDKEKDWIYFGARCDNDNFAMMIRDMPEDETREKLIAFFDDISRLEYDPSYQIYYRCGVVNMRTAMNSGETVADCAKLAQTLGTGINTTEINFYTNEIHENILWGKQLKAYLDTAIRADEFVVYLQPKIDISEECICGAEALVRWNYKHKEFMIPFRFIPYLETDDSIIKVDNVVLHKVCARMKEWKEKGYTLYPISVNLSRKHIEQPFLVNHLTNIVDSYGIEHSLIEFELTETAAYDNQTYLISVMNDFKKKGFLISMDDFGTGYSSFALLKRMPLDTLKIDKSFVDLITSDDDSNKIKIILHHIICMSEELGIHCIAEGVEEYDQVLELKDLGCETVQGYYYSKPIPIQEFEKKYLH